MIAGRRHVLGFGLGTLDVKMESPVIAAIAVDLTLINVYAIISVK